MVIGESDFYELTADERAFFAASPDQDDAWDQDTGKPGLTLFSSAIQVWSVLQDGSRTTVAEAAAAFNVSPLMIAAAVKSHPWMFLEGPDDDFSKLSIEHEGE
jgi:hypothetical protein